MVEAAGVEPAPPQNANWLMARDFSSELSDNSLPCCQFVVLWSALESSGVLPSLGDIVETGMGRMKDGRCNLQTDQSTPRAPRLHALSHGGARDVHTGHIGAGVLTDFGELFHGTRRPPGVEPLHVAGEQL